ncbi:MAG: hypothetical protein Q8M02_14215 [Candidatus Didemnitutus sp.]|nr:hypothetical protein [Candidatus Didemnitutus sp.]
MKARNNSWIGWHAACESSRVLLAFHSLHFRVHTRVWLTLLVALAATALLWAGPTHYAPVVSSVVAPSPHAAPLPALFF